MHQRGTLLRPAFGRSWDSLLSLPSPHQTQLPFFVYAYLALVSPRPWCLPAGQDCTTHAMWLRNPIVSMECLVFPTWGQDLGGDDWQACEVMARVEACQCSAGPVPLGSAVPLRVWQALGPVE